MERERGWGKCNSSKINNDGRKEPTVVNSLFGSVAASIVAQTICHPLDTCKTRIQGPEGHLFRNTPQTLSKTFREEGFRALYRGFGAILVGGTPGYVLYLTSYEACRNSLMSKPLGEKFETVVHLSSGIIAEAICCVVFVPVDVVKERLQVQRSLPGTLSHVPMHNGSLDIFQKILRTDGFKGLYKGYGATLLSYGPYSAIYFALYEKMKDSLANLANCSKEDLGIQYLLGSSAIAASTAAWITNPLDLAKLRLQVQTQSPSAIQSPDYKHFNYGNIFDGIKKIYRSEGLRGLYKGSCARVVFEAPNMAIAISLYDMFKRLSVSLFG